MTVETTLLRQPLIAGLVNHRGVTEGVYNLDLFILLVYVFSVVASFVL